MKNYLILILLSFLSFSIYAKSTIFDYPVNLKNPNPNFVNVQKMLAKTSNLTGDFKQIRNIKLLSSPLISTGTFSISKKNGLHWDQSNPFISKLTVTENKIIQKMQNAPPTIITKQKQPIVFSFTKIFLSVFKGNTKMLENYFNIFFMGNQKYWTIALTPKASPLNKAIESIQLKGQQYLQQVVIQEKKGNQLTIIFSNIKTIKN